SNVPALPEQRLHLVGAESDKPPSAHQPTGCNPWAGAWCRSSSSAWRGWDEWPGDSVTDPIHYERTMLKVTIADTQTGDTARQPYKIDITDIVGGPAVHVGFTAGTGVASA